MGLIQKDAFRTMIISYAGMVLGYVNKGLLFIWLLNTEEIGLINLLVSVGLLFGNLSGLGNTYAIWKFFPFLRSREKKHHGFLLLAIIVVLIGTAVFTLIVFLFRTEIAAIYGVKSALFVHYYYWIIPLGFANALFLVMDTFLRSMYYNVISVLVYELVLRVLISVLLVLFGTGLLSFDSFLVLHCLMYFVPVVVLACYLFRKDELHLSFRHLSIPRRFRKIILSFSLFSYFNSIGALVVVTLDAMMIAGMIGLKATGVYTTIIYLTSALQIPYKSMLRISAPLVAEYWKDRNMAEMNTLYKKFSSVNLVVSLTVFLIVWVCRTEIFHFLPKEYESGIYVFLFLMIGRLMDMYLGLNGVIFVTSKKYRYDIVFTLALIGIVFLLNLLLIPVYGITGTAVATCIAYIVYNIGRLAFVYAVYRIHPFEKKQLYVMLLFVAVLFLFEWLPLPFSGDVVPIIVKWILLGILFLLPVYAFKMEMEIVRYVDNALLLVKKKLVKRPG